MPAQFPMVMLNKPFPKVPLTCIPSCHKIKHCSQNAVDRKIDYAQNYRIKEPLKYLKDVDNYWSELLKRQQESSANYLYNIQIFGNGNDPTQIKKPGIANEFIQQRMMHLPQLGALHNLDKFYLLSFILNFVKIKSLQSRRILLERMRKQNLLDYTILNYMQIMARHPSSGLESQELKEFLKLTSEAMKAEDSKQNYYNPKRIFIKCLQQIDPYELIYLKTIMETKKQLDQQQYLYLVNFVEQLQEMKSDRRNEYLKYLHGKGILPSDNFDSLIYYISNKKNKFNGQKLKILLQKLFSLLQLEPCVEEAKTNLVISTIATSPYEIDARQLQNSLRALSQKGLQNIIHVTFVRKFLKDLLALEADYLNQILKKLKSNNILPMEHIRMLVDYLLNESSIKVDIQKKKDLAEMLKKLAASPAATVPSSVLLEPNIKGPDKSLTGIQWENEKCAETNFFMKGLRELVARKK